MCDLSWLWVLMLAVPPAWGTAPPARKIVTLKGCEIGYERTTTLGAFVLVEAGGRVQDCYVRPGDRVKAGQVLGRLHDRNAVVELARLRVEYESDIDVRLGTARVALAKAKVLRSENLYQQHLISREDLDLHRLELKTYELETEQALQRRQTAGLLVKRMEAEVASREFVCPHDGTVVEIIKNVGESCICNEAVMRIVRDDVVWVTGYADVANAWDVARGQPARVFPEVEGADISIESRVFPARVVFVDSRVDPLNQTCKIAVEVDNRDRLLRSGVRARLEIDVTPGAKAGAEAPEATPIVTHR